MPLIIADCAEELKGGFEVVTNFTDGCQITTPIAIVGSTPDRHDILVGEMILITFVHELMSPCNQRQIVDVTEFISHAITK